MKISYTEHVSPGMRLLAWINIVFQIVFPLSVTFAPAIASEGSERRFLKRKAQTDWQTAVYTLKEGESVASVAQKYNIPLDSLRKLNQFRTFARGFDLLQAGDELDVPLAPLPEVHWDDATPASISTQSNEDLQANKIAGYASQAGNFLSGSVAAASMARDMATGAAGGEIQQWLSRFGTARVRLDADKNLSLKNSQLELLVPLYEQKESLIFNQANIHRTDDRTQFNLGLGYRWFAADSMLGANTFLDYDLSRDHSRFGLGGEYWRNFLKLGVNAYYRLTGWKNSPDLEDYEERPANGWDVRAQYWLPSLPQLGGKLTYEQYYGDKVGLFGRDNRQQNPHTITVGVNYTPIPLLTFNAEQRQGQSGKSDTHFGVDMNYQLNTPWQHQINPDEVAAMRSLAGSRYDLVERNNNIVLEYRKKEVIRLKTADLVTGYAEEQRSLGVSVNSKYGLERIDWSASPLIAAGGKIVQSGGDWAVLLPSYRSGAGSVNNYIISGVAVDKKGNISNRADTQVSVTQAAIDTANSSLSPPVVTLPADGISRQELVFKVKDKEGLPVDIAENEISVESNSRLRGVRNATLSPFTRRAAGEYVMTVTSGTVPETFTVTPLARNMKFASADIKLTADNATAMINALDVIEDNAIADGKSQNRFRVTVVDAQSNPVPGQTVSLQADNNATLAESAITEADGTVIVPVTSRLSGDTTVTASINKKGGKTLKLSFRPDQNTARVKGSISVTPASATVGDVVTYTAVLTDVNENALGAGIPVTWSANEGSVLSAQMTYTDDSGTASVTLSRTLAGTAKVNLILPSGTTPAPDVIFSAGDVDENRSELSLTPSVIVAGKETATLTLTLRDSNGNLLTGEDVSGNSDNSDVIIGESQENNNSPGHYTMTVNSDKAGSATVTVSVGGTTLNKSRMLTVKGDTDSWELSELTPDKTSLTAGDATGVIYSVVVTDAYGNPLNNVVVSWQLRGQAESYAPTSRTNEQGVATTTVKSNTAGLLQMTAYLDEDNHAKADDVIVVAGDIKNATFGANKTSIGSDGMDTVTLTASLEDTYGNPVTGKNVIVEGGDSLQGFTLSEVQDQLNGHYVATGTATTKGQVTLSASVEGKQVGNSVTITVGAVTPDLRFDNTEQQATWTRSYEASQKVKGMPKDMEQIWSSSDKSVATVDGTGKVTLLKSGDTNISVYIPGNSQYNSASASYNLKVNRANPGLVLPNTKPMVARWADGVERSITPTFTNADVANSLKLTYTASDEKVVTVDKAGKLSPVKPGTATILVSTPQTDQFLASSGIISYTLNKGLINLEFNNDEVSTTDQATFVLQPTKQEIPQGVNAKWSSSDSDIVKLSESGSVEGAIKPGKTQISVQVIANDYYENSSGFYQLKVYGTPGINVGDITYMNDGTEVKKGEWRPLFVQDVMKFSLSSDSSNTYTAPVLLKVDVTDDNGKIILTQSFNKDLGKIRTVTITPNKEFFGKALHVKAFAVGHENLRKTHTIDIDVWKPGVSDIVKYLSGSISYYIAYHDTTNGTAACQANAFEGLTDFDGSGVINLNTGNRELISKVEAKLSTTLSSINGDGIKTGEQVVATLDATTSSTSNNQPKAIYERCYWNHGQGLIVGNLRVNFNGDEKYNVVASITDADGAGKNKDKAYPLDTTSF